MYTKVLDNLAEVFVAAFHVTDDVPLSLNDARTSLSFCDIALGDFASNIALVMAKKIGKSPREIAEALVSHLTRHELIASAEVAGPGFVNIRLDLAVWQQLLDELKVDFYQTDQGSGKSVNVEFISANPTGPLVLVNAWGGFYGDVLASVFASQGYKVTREYYLNDGGNQIRQLGRAVQQAAGMKFSEEESAVLYRGEYIDSLAQKLASEFGSQAELLAVDAMQVGDKAKQIIFTEMIQPTLQRLGIHHDVVFSETTLDNSDTLNRIEEQGALKKADGAIWLDGARVGLEKDEVLVRSSGGGDTYFLKDITYQLNKLEKRNFDQAITIVGPDHHGQEQRLLAALHLLGTDSFVPLWTQTVRLTKDGQEYKMSKRRGNYIILDDLLDMIPADTARFFFAMRDTNSHFDLDLDLVSAQNKHNPLYYVMYSYVRAGSILQKAGEFEPASRLVLNAEQQSILRGFVQIAEVIRQATVTYQVHPILYQVIDLARRFHDWYERNPIVTENDQDLRSSRLAFVQHYKLGLKGIFELIGITPVEKM